jgi:hypothetical protein
VAEEPFVPDPSDFSERLVTWNGLREAGFAAWQFLPGMRFAEREAWWRGGNDRAAAHEGLDVCWFRTGDGKRLSLGAGARVPAVYPGEVVAVVDDFLGISVFVAHAQRDTGGRQLHTIYGHLLPQPGLAPGSLVGDGDAVGTIAGTSGAKRAVPPHLRLTLALIDREHGPERLDWAAMGEKSRVLLLDPMMTMKP